jgi:chromosomal replication initiation ATPase DnaA
MSETWQEIASAVAWRHGVTLEDMRGPRVFRKVAYARHEAFSELYKTGRFSLPRIGKWFGDRDHTTVLHGIRKHDARQDMHTFNLISHLPSATSPDGAGRGAQPAPT